MLRLLPNLLPYLLAALLGGCALPMVGPDAYTLDLKLPAAWTTRSVAVEPAGAPAPLARWWLALADSELDWLVEQALAGNLGVQEAQARLQQARAGRDLSEAALFPSLSASVGSQRSKSSEAIAKQPTRTLYDAGFDASWEVDLFGGTRRGLEAAEADLAAKAASLEQVRVSLVAEVARNYVDVRAGQRRIAIAQQNLNSQAETLQITEWRYQAGLARASEVEQAKTSLAQTRAGIPDLEVALAAAENRLAVLLGRAPGTLHARLQLVQSLPSVPATVATGIPADVLRQRPDLIAAERTLAAETARVGQKLAQRFPSLNLSASFGWQAYSFAALGGAGTVARAVGGTLAANLFDGGRLRQQVAVQNAVQAQALAAYQGSVLTALEEVENALVGYAAARQRLEARHAAADAARQAADLSRHLYQSGLADFQQVLETQRTQLSAEDSLASADATLRTTLIALYKALGGGWSSSASEQTS